MQRECDGADGERQTRASVRGVGHELLGKEASLDRIAHAPELLDGPLDDDAALRGNLRDLRRINRLLGGSRLSRAALRHLIGRGRSARLLDVGTGGADIPLDLRAGAVSWGCDLSIVCVDNRSEVLAAARRLDARLDGDGVSLVLADGRSLPWPDRSFDVAHASLVLHHLEPAEAVAFLAELGRVCRRGVIVNDLARGRVWWGAAVLGTRLLTRNPLTRHDAPLSVRRAYTRREAAGLIRAAGLKPVFEARGLLGHRFAIAAVPSDSRRVAAMGRPE